MNWVSGMDGGNWPEWEEGDWGDWGGEEMIQPQGCDGHGPRPGPLSVCLPSTLFPVNEEEAGGWDQPMSHKITRGYFLTQNYWQFVYKIYKRFVVINIIQMCVNVSLEGKLISSGNYLNWKFTVPEMSTDALELTMNCLLINPSVNWKCCKWECI